MNDIAYIIITRSLKHFEVMQSDRLLVKKVNKIPSKLVVTPPLKMWTGWMGDG